MIPEECEIINEWISGNNTEDVYEYYTGVALYKLNIRQKRFKRTDMICLILWLVHSTEKQLNETLLNLYQFQTH